MTLAYGIVGDSTKASNPVTDPDDLHLTFIRYVERNAKRAKRVKKSEHWRWSSAWRRESGTVEKKKLCSTWPVPKPKDYSPWLNQTPSEGEEKVMGSSVGKGNPDGGDSWVASVVIKM